MDGPAVGPVRLGLNTRTYSNLRANPTAQRADHARQKLPPTTPWLLAWGGVPVPGHGERRGRQRGGMSPQPRTAVSGHRSPDDPRCGASVLLKTPPRVPGCEGARPTCQRHGRRPCREGAGPRVRHLRSPPTVSALVEGSRDRLTGRLAQERSAGCSRISEQEDPHYHRISLRKSI